MHITRIRKLGLPVAFFMLLGSLWVGTFETLSANATSSGDTKLKQLLQDKLAILQQDVGCVNRIGDKGFMLARGALWFDKIESEGMRIISINQPIE